MKKTLSASIFVLAALHVSAQGITVFQDTVVCSDDPVTLSAVVDGSYSTESYTVDSIPYSPEPVGGTVVNMVDDTYTGPYDIGFDFCFFGEVYDEFYICSNGWISFVTPVGGWATNWTPDGPIPSAVGNVPKTAIFGPWTDWHTGLCSNCIFYELVGTAPNRRMIITYEDVPLFSCTSFEGTFQIVLYETSNNIVNHLIDVDVCTTWDLGIATQGIHNQDGTVAFTAPGRNATEWDAAGESWQYLADAITWYDASTGDIVGTGDSIVVAPAVTTTYIAEVALCDGEVYTDSATVTISAPFDVDWNLGLIQCFGDADGFIDLNVTGNLNPMIYEWSTGATSDNITGLGPGTYTVTVEEEDGCALDFEFVLTQPDALTLIVDDFQDITCFEGNDGYIYLNPGGGVLPYSISDGTATGTDSLFELLTAGSYTFTLTDANGCEATVTQVLNQPDELVVDAGTNPIIPFGGQTLLDAVTNAMGSYTIVWLPTTDLSCADCLNPVASPDNTTTYTITVTDENGCIATDLVTVNVQLDFTVPNAFTPNGDGLNDQFIVRADFLETFEMVIYNRWGEEIFRSEDILKGWDGMFNDKEQEVGTYMFLVKATTINGNELLKTGTVSLLR